MRTKQRIGITITMIGLGFVLVAVGAPWLGLDKDVGWGPARRFMLSVGLVLSLIPHLRTGWLWIRLALRGDLEESDVELSGIGEGARASGVPLAPAELNKKIFRLPRRSRMYIACIIVVCIALLSMATMLWLSTTGTWVHWYNTTEFIPLLADGFRAGKTHLLVEPNEKLLSLEDPYPYKNRENLSYLWDASLFEGKYYLYWGPTPGLILAPFRGILPNSLGDQHIGWFFTSGVVILLLLFLLRIWRWFFPHLPLLGFAIAVLAAGFIPSVIWLASRMAVYEVAIASGQFFLLLGLHVLFPWDKLSAFRLFIVGIAWSFAVGSRVTLGPVVSILACSYLVWVGIDSFKQCKWKHLAKQFLPFLMPLLIGALLLLWYNFTRFGSLLEFGHRYQLGRADKGELYETVIALVNIFPNLYNYLLNGVKRLSIFPYIKPLWGQYGIPFLKLYAGEQFHTEQVTGLLITSPFIIFSAAPIFQWIVRWWEKLDSPNGIVRESRPPILSKERGHFYKFIVLVVSLTWIPILLFQVSANRHLVDVSPSLALLSAFGFWHSLNHTRGRPPIRNTILLLGSGTALFTTIMAVLLSFTGYHALFEKHNPDLFYKLTEWFTW